MIKLLKNCDVNRYNDDIISLTLFGSYSTKFWVENKSDIDILILVKHLNFDLEYKLEQYYREIL